MNEIITTPAVSQGEMQILKSKEMFIEEMKRAINNELVDSFFNRPDCIVSLVWNIHKTATSVMDDSIINGLLNYLIQIIASDECNYKWCISSRETLKKNYASRTSGWVAGHVEGYQKELQLSDSDLEITDKLTIKDLAKDLRFIGEINDFIWHDHFEFIEDGEFDLRLFLFRLIEIDSEDYYDQGWF